MGKRLVYREGANLLISPYKRSSLIWFSTEYQGSKFIFFQIISAFWVALLGFRNHPKTKIRHISERGNVFRYYAMQFLAFRIIALTIDWYFDYTVQKGIKWYKEFFTDNLWLTRVIKGNFMEESHVSSKINVFFFR